MGLLLTTGKRAAAPYRITWAGRNVYCLEELCYCLVQSAQFVGEELPDPALVRWLSEECGLPELARELSGYLGGDPAQRGETAADFAETLLRATDFIPEDQREQALHIIRAGEGLAHYEQREARADYLRSTGYFYQALSEYDRILEELPAPERKLRARVEHSRGVIYAGLFDYAMAAECFQRAMALDSAASPYIDYLAAIRLYLPGTDYVSFVARHPEAYEASLALEKHMDAAEAAYASGEGAGQIRHLRELLAQTDSRSTGAAAAGERTPAIAGRELQASPEQQFAEELQGTVRDLRENYRLNRNRVF